MLAKQGYDTFAADLYGEGNRPVEIKAKKQETGKLYIPMQPQDALSGTSSITRARHNMR
jgi:hypothetical protein